MTEILAVIAEKLDSCDRAKILSIPEDIREAIDQGLTPDEIIENGLLEGLNSVGAKFKVGDVFIPEVLVAARAIHQSMETLRPLLKNGKARHRGRIVLGTVVSAPMRAREAEAILKGKRIDDELIEKAAQIAADESRPRDSIRGYADYRREMVRILSRDALRQAFERTQSAR